MKEEKLLDEEHVSAAALPWGRFELNFSRLQLNLTQGSSAAKAPHQHVDTAAAGEGQSALTPEEARASPVFGLVFRRTKQDEGSDEGAGGPKLCCQQYRQRGHGQNFQTSAVE